eukprot:TRINITY_DN6896_c0_g1_i1.p1 TRINITY_DN6896_c0_g1~~TRINITY_DN6896_c0_g1_i1.p1  ORF type:complete len:273 (-),score=119.00 TRINITY_DN6896_c0_g1_i1:142-900(-)
MSVSPIIHLKVGDVHPHCLVVGDPGRADKIALLLEDSKEVAKVREYHVYSGLWKGIPVTVASHGVGGPGTNVAIHELIWSGAKVIIRAGTAGSFQKSLERGSHTIVTGAVRDDGCSQLLVPEKYPAVSHHEVTIALIEAAKQFKTVNPEYNYQVGLCQSVGNFYEGPLGNNNMLWVNSNVLCQDMEVSLVLVQCSLHPSNAVKAGAILNTDNYILATDRADSSSYDPYSDQVRRGSETMIEVALNALTLVTP